MSKTYEEYLPDPYVQPEDLEMAQETYLCDLDGTIAFRQPGPDGTTRGIHDYHRVDEDGYVEDICVTVATLQRSGSKIIFVSGRPESCRGLSTAWINRLGVLRTDDDNPLYMRTTGDYRPDTVVKRELFDQFIRPQNLRIASVYDDRNRVVKMWREQLGLTVCHVADHDF